MGFEGLKHALRAEKRILTKSPDSPKSLILCSDRTVFILFGFIDSDKYGVDFSSIHVGAFIEIIDFKVGLIKQIFTF